MITDEEMQKALETVKKYCDEKACEECNFFNLCGESFDKGFLPYSWTIKKDEN